MISKYAHNDNYSHIIFPRLNGYLPLYNTIVIKEGGCFNPQETCKYKTQYNTMHNTTVTHPKSFQISD